MEKYDVIIVGAGPAGLQCAYRLANTGLKILILEKNEVIGDKVCAGGLTLKDLKILDLPDDLVEKKVFDVTISSPMFTSRSHSEEPVLYTINRKALGRWMADRLKGTDAQVLTRTRVTGISDHKVYTDNGDVFEWRFLVGADGVTSTVRKYMNLPVEKKLFTMQYRVPSHGESRFELHLNAHYFNAWYGWVFPHKDHLVVGTCADIRYVSSKTVKARFHEWMHQQYFDLDSAVYESYPINYDYRGWDFDPVFLAGEAAGLASGFTGEGIYQALVSGESVAARILGSTGPIPGMEKILRYNRQQHRFLDFIIKIGPFRNVIFNMILGLLKTSKPFQGLINKSFS